MCGPDYRDFADLQMSLSYLYHNFNKQYQYDVIIFHENLADADIAALEDSVFGEMNIRYEKVIPDPPVDAPKDVIGSTVNYRWMCRWFSGPFYNHPAIEKYKWCWHFDTDSFLLEPVGFDPFSLMAKTGKTYGYQVILKEPDFAAVGFWEATKDFIIKYELKTKSLMKHLDDSGEWNCDYFYSDFAIFDLDFFRSDKYMAYFRHLDDKNGFYQHRWGDTLTATMAVFMFLDEKDLHCFQDTIAWRHQGYNSILARKNKCQ